MEIDDDTKIFRVVIPGLLLGWIALGIVYLRYEQPRMSPEEYNARVSREPVPTVYVGAPAGRAPAKNDSLTVPSR
jgi:hypothetical protein